MSKPNTHMLQDLLENIRHCQLCIDLLPLGPRPVISAHADARILIIGQAPGTRVHATGIPWNDPSGNRLREWMGVDKETFYDEQRIAIMPMGFCYPGKGRSGDLPPRPECAPKWHDAILQRLPSVELTLLVGLYAQRHYLTTRYPTLTDTVRHWQEYGKQYLPLPHPSPRNQIWLKKNPWFKDDVIPELKRRIAPLL